MVWGSYIEAAALMGHSIRILGEKGNAEAFLRKAKDEALALREEEQQTLSTLAQKGKYLLAVSKETLRFHPQTAGGLRVNPVDRKLCGYDIPAESFSPPTRALRFSMNPPSRTLKRSILRGSSRLRRARTVFFQVGWANISVRGLT